jgi:hypothetical protein
MADGVAAQDVINLGATRLCNQCNINVERVVTLGVPEGEGYVGYPTGIGKLGNGDWVLVQSENSTQLTVFAPDGRFRHRLGRAGAGPDEYRWITFLQTGADDSVRVYDAGLGRLSILDANLKTARTIQLGVKGPYGVVFLPHGLFVAAVELSTIEHLGYPLHLFGSDGKVIRSFGALRPEYRRNRPGALIRWVAPAGSDGIWSGHFLAYVIEKWTADGALIARYVRDVDWFQPHDHYGYNGSRAPNTALVSLYQDSAGNLWTMLRTADPNWQRGVGARTGPLSDGSVGVRDRAAYYDTIIEVFDPRTAGILASRRVPDYLVRFDSQGNVIGYREDSGGHPYIDVYRVHLERGRFE